MTYYMVFKIMKITTSSFLFIVTSVIMYSQ